MKKKCLLLLLGVSMLVASGCGKKETVTAEELLGNPYGSAVESGDFDVTMKLTNADGEQTSSGNLQFDKDGVHFKSSDKEYYLIRSNSYVKGYDYVADTGRWTVKDEDSLDTSTMANLGIITNAVLSDWVITGDSTFDKAGHFGTEVTIPGESPLGVTLTFDKDTKRLLKAEYVLKEEQPGGVKAYSLTVICKSVNNIKVQLPDDIKNNAIAEGGGSSSQQMGSMLPDELIGTIGIEPGSDILEILDEMGAEKTEYDGIYYYSLDDYNEASLKKLENEGMTEFVEQVRKEQEIMETASTEDETSETKESESSKSNESDESEESESTKASEGAQETEGAGGSGVTEATEPSETTAPNSTEPSRVTSDQFFGMTSDGKMAALAGMYPEFNGGTGADFDSLEFFAAMNYPNAQAVLSACSYWSSLSEEDKYGVAIHVDLGTVSLEQCVSAGADGDFITSAIDTLNGR